MYNLHCRYILPKLVRQKNQNSVEDVEMAELEDFRSSSLKLNKHHSGDQNLLGVAPSPPFSPLSVEQPTKAEDGTDASTDEDK